MRKTDDPYDLRRFLEAQTGVLPGGSDFGRVYGELKNGRKTSHWMWYIFPQISGLGGSDYAVRYSIKSLSEARAYLADPVLGPRLIDCSKALLAVNGNSAWEILGKIDSIKLRSSMTLFEQVAEPGSVFSKVIDKYYSGERDVKTLQILERLEGRT